MMQIPISELTLRAQKISNALQQKGCDAILLRSVPNHLYLTGSVYLGFTYLKAGEAPIFFSERPTSIFEGYDHSRIHYIRKPEQIPDILSSYGYALGEKTCLELSFIPQSEYQRLSKLTTEGYSTIDGSILMREVRSIKTPYELEVIRQTAQKHMEIYKLAPDLYVKGMTDLDWQFRIEYEMRKRGSIGTFRCFGSRMEIFMGNISAGTNAKEPAPYDFALGGAGRPELPLGASGVPLTSGMAIMIDMAGNYSQYNSDISRVYSLGDLPDEVCRAHQLSVDMHDYFQSSVHPGVEVSSLFKHCMLMVEEAGLSSHFMGETFQVKFLGHGVGIEINEPPVIMERWSGTFEENMAIAFEPKFVFDPVGAVGIENTYIVTANEVDNITPLPTDIIKLHD